jgi:cobalamin biosynthesis protein CobD/CbiB
MVVERFSSSKKEKTMNRGSKFSWGAWLGVLALPVVMLLSACASVETTPIRNTIANAELAISEAERLAAHQHAPLELRLAREKVESARAALEQEEYQRADWLAEEALAEAQLAQAKARSIRTEMIIGELRDSVDTLEQETQRMQPTQ